MDKKFENFVNSLKKSKFILDNKFSEDVIEQLKIFYIDYYVNKNCIDEYPKKPTLILHKLINNNVPCDDWCYRLKQIKKPGFTKEKCILTYGEEKGLEKWNAYVKFQSVKNTFEYKSKKYGMSKDEFDLFNSSRATTLSNMISRYGESEGTIKWNEYVERQRYTTSLEYFKSEYGDYTGQEKYNNYINTITKNIDALNKRTNCTVSKLELSICDIFSQYYKIETQYVFENQSTYISAFDIYIPDLNLLVEVNGDFWHMNPKIYSPDYINPMSNISAKHKWHLDKVKMMKARRHGFNVEVIWESDYKSKKESIILGIIKKYEKRNN